MGGASWMNQGASHAHNPGGAPNKMMRVGGMQPETTSTGQWVSGAVKSFNVNKGFGFISCPGINEDVFFMKSDLPVGAHESMTVGTDVSFEMIQTADGKLRASGVTL